MEARERSGAEGARPGNPAFGQPNPNTSGKFSMLSRASITNQADQQPDSKKVSPPRHGLVYIVLVLFAFNFSSISAIFINKAILTGFGFKYPLTLYTVQGTATMSIVVLMRMFGFLSDWRLKRETMIKLIPCSIVYWLNIMCGLGALSLVNIPMFSTLRRLTVVFTLVSEIINLGKYPTRNIALTVLLIGTGSLMSGMTDATFSALGYALVFLNNSLTAFYLTLVKKALGEENSVSPFVLALYLYGYNLPPTIGLWLLAGEFRAMRALFATSDELHSPYFFVLMSLSAVSGFSITYFTVLSTELTSPLTTVVAAQAKNALQNLAGMFTWDYVFHPVNFIGIVISLSGQVWFGFEKYKESYAYIGTAVANSGSEPGPGIPDVGQKVESDDAVSIGADSYAKASKSDTS